MVAPLENVADWGERYRWLWDESYERLEEYLERLQERLKEQETRHDRHGT